MEQFNSEFSKYEGLKGKKNTFYIYVINRCPCEELTDHISGQLKTISSIGDTYKRRLFSAQYKKLLDLIRVDYPPESTVDEIFFIGEDLNRHKICEEWSSLLKKYNCNKINYCYDDHYDLVWLKDYLTNDDPYEIVHVNNNRFNHILLTKTKKTTTNSVEDKALTLQDFVQTNLSNKRYVVYGVSSKLKGFNDPNAYSVVSGNLTDSELINIVDRIENEDKIVQLKKDLTLINSSKTMHRVKFKTEMVEALRGGTISHIYITPESYSKFKENAPRAGVELPSKIIIIDPQIPSFQTGEERLICQHGNVVGITYY